MARQRAYQRADSLQTRVVSQRDPRHRRGMANESVPHGPKRSVRLARLARLQWGNVTRRQLLALGFSTGEVRGLAERGVLHRMHRAVYAFGAPSRAPEQRWAAALLAAGTGAVLSHKSAAALWGLLPVREVIEVSAPTRRRGDATLKVHDRSGLELTRHRGLRVTTVSQTLLDLAATGWPIDRLTHEAAASSLVSLDSLRAFAQDKRGARGAARLNDALGLPHTRSGWERRFLRWLRTLEGDIPMPRANDVIDGLTVDLHWPDHDLVVELDTEQTHGTRWAQERDRRRDERLRRRGKTVIRIRRESFDAGATEHELRARLRARARPSRCSAAGR
jgi:very-short-patch-repair endonuclease